MTFRGFLAIRVALALLLVPAALRAEVTRIEISSRSDVLDGKSFGATGKYEQLVGKAFFAVDPRHPRNRIIVDLDKAPRNAKGQVEFWADVSILKPKDPSRGNGVLFFDIINRGNSVLLGTFNRADASAPLGDEFLMREGYTLVTVGWETDVAEGRPALHPPVATDRGQPITGRLSNWFIPSDASPTFDLTASYWTGFRVYPPLESQGGDAVLTERVGFFGERKLVERETWQFGRPGADGKLVNDPHHVYLKTGFKPGYTYELSYPAKDPLIAGLGFAAVRDVASAFKYDRSAVVTGRFAYAFGSSQTGRFLREFVYEGFTTDERDRQAFDAIHSHIAGVARGNFNKRFAQPNEGGFFATTWFPFVYDVTKDPATGKVDGLGARIAAGVRPKIFITNSSSEYWGKGQVAALNHVSIDGRQDLREAENVRIFLLASTQHGAGRLPPPDTGGQLKGNANDYRWAMRALITGLDGWVRKGEVPPPSQHPRLSNGTLVAQKDIKFPGIPGVQWPHNVPGGHRGDLPGPLTSHPLPFLVPQVDTDGNETGGIRLPDISVPLATFTGWAFRSERIGAPGELIANTGSYIPFAATRAERERKSDPRPSIAERYSSRTEYLRRVEEAARRLVGERYVLQADVAAIVNRAADHWDLLMGTAASSVGGQ